MQTCKFFSPGLDFEISARTQRFATLTFLRAGHTNQDYLVGRTGGRHHRHGATCAYSDEATRDSASLRLASPEERRVGCVRVPAQEGRGALLRHESVAAGAYLPLHVTQLGLHRLTAAF